MGEIIKLIFGSNLIIAEILNLREIIKLIFGSNLIIAEILNLRGNFYEKKKSASSFKSVRF